MFKYLLLHIPSGNYVHIFRGSYAQRSGSVNWVKFMRSKEYIWGWEIPDEAEPMKFASKRRIKIWLRQRAHKLDTNEFDIIEITE